MAFPFGKFRAFGFRQRAKLRADEAPSASGKNVAENCDARNSYRVRMEPVSISYAFLWWWPQTGERLFSKLPWKFRKDGVLESMLLPTEEEATYKADSSAWSRAFPEVNSHCHDHNCSATWVKHTKTATDDD